MGHTYRGGKSGGELLTLFGGYSYDGVSAGIWVIHTEVANLGASWSRFFAVTLMMALGAFSASSYLVPFSPSPMKSVEADMQIDMSGNQRFIMSSHF